MTSLQAARLIISVVGTALVVYAASRIGGQSWMIFTIGVLFLYAADRAR